MLPSVTSTVTVAPAVFSTGGFNDDSLDSRWVWAVHVEDGSATPGWPVAADGSWRTSVALGDVVPGDGGRQKVVLGDRAGAVSVFAGDGRRLWRPVPGPRGDNGNGYYGGPTVGDLDGDQDVATGYGLGGALLLDGRNVGLLAAVGGTRFAFVGAPAIVDFGAAGGRHLIVPGWGPRFPASRRSWSPPLHCRPPRPGGLAAVPQGRPPAGGRRQAGTP